LKPKTAYAFRLELALEAGVVVIAAHAGTPGKSLGQDNLERVLIMMARHPNLYADISSLTQVNKLGSLKRLLARPEARGRLIYGTDFPLIETALVSPFYQVWRAPFGSLWAASKEPNAWDRDVALKKALGVPEEVFTKSAELLLPENP
jgi:predicted TIM-barrel fold metal-dependent hydrolase